MKPPMKPRRRVVATLRRIIEETDSATIQLEPAVRRIAFGVMLKHLIENDPELNTPARTR